MHKGYYLTQSNLRIKITSRLVAASYIDSRVCIYFSILNMPDFEMYVTISGVLKLFLVRCQLGSKTEKNGASYN